MNGALYVRRADTERSQTPAGTSKTPPQAATRSTTLPRSPVWTQAWGVAPAPWLRVSSPQQPAAIQRIVSSPASIGAPSQREDGETTDTIGEAGDLESGTPLSDSDLLTIPEIRVIFERREDLTVGSSSHTLSFQLVSGELELGMASFPWETMNTIDTDIRARLGYAGLSQAYKDAWRRLLLARGGFNAAKKNLASLEKEINALLPRSARNLPARAILRELEDDRTKLKKYQKLKAQEPVRGTAVDMATATYEQAARQFINTAFEHHGPDVGDILAHFAPTQIAAPHAALNVPANTYRYHQGTAADPIPVIWYKPLNQYPAMNLPLAYDVAGNQPGFNLIYPAGGTVYDRPPGPNRITYTFGVVAANRVPGQVIGNAFDIRNARQTNTRATQQELNQVIVGFGFNMNNLDGDHVKDLGFRGTDTIDNFWPLPRTVNQRALIWRQAYRFHFKEQDDQGNWVLRSGTINGLPNRYFRIKGEQNQNIPTESALNNGVTAGSDTSYGAAQNIDVNGVNVQEA